ncbi:hypothetical protein BT93_K1262 [Corymbia citriodora subsp. variegata]|nr:hypothetical protein BT93_K1262 [Corymbia citriodora subsp. variegata]
MKRKERIHLEDPAHGVSSTWTFPNVDDHERGTKKQKGNYFEVFLSFRGKDTRKGFADYLYNSLVDAGIYVFIDDEELRVGKEIGPELLCSITQSKISIPIISKNYASSKWCLHELAQMLKCKRSRGQIVLPMFYKVKPLQGRHLMGRLGDAVNAHKRNLDEMVVKEWEEALKEVSFLKGWESEKIDNGHEGAIVKMVVRRVMSELKRLFQLIVPRQLVGIDDRVEKIMSWIDARVDGTRIIGIYGMGGIGKTTLAKVLYNKLSSQYEDFSFVADIRETSQRTGIECLQKQLISDIIGNSCDVANVDEGIRVIKSRFRFKKVLVLLDDMDTNIHVNALVGDGSWFKAGSMVIITTRNKSILDEARTDYIYQLNELSLDQSLILFSRHAFRKDSQSDYKVISRDVVSTTAGLPLALEVIGSFLCGKREEVWKDTLKKLKKVPDKKVQEKLRISYEVFDYEEQQIFLDIACIFNGSSKQNPAYMWDACGFFPSKGIEVLSLMSLIKIDEDGELMMHDQLRDLGREIVHLENQKRPQKRSRLWNYEEAIDVLDSNKGTKKIEALRLGKYSRERTYKAEQFKKLTNLRFLQINGANFTGDFQSLLPQLRWLQWEDCPLDFTAANLHLKKLVVLDLSWSGISEYWGGWGPLKMSTELKVMNLRGCKSLRRTPKLSTFKSLEILILEDCWDLEEIHPSIEDIKTLVSLNIRRCWRLKELPAGIGVDKLPESISSMKELENLVASSYARLAKLQELRASRCKNLGGLPSSIGELVSLNKLDLDKSGILGLPESTSKLSSLQNLSVLYCEKLRELPEVPSGLTALGITCQSSSLPHLSQLYLLKKLILFYCCWLECLPELPIGLAMLSITRCGKLKALTNLSNLKQLFELILDECFELTEVTRLEGLQPLSNSHVRQCPKISWLDEVESFESLRGLQIDKGFPDSSKLTNLKASQLEGSVDLSNSKILQETKAASCVNLVEIQSLDGSISSQMLDF